MTGSPSPTTKDLIHSLKALSQGIVVLYAEDDEDIRTATTELLESFGVKVVQAQDGLEAWEKLQTAQFDLLLTDIRMPRMDGIQLISKVKNQLLPLGIVVTSAHSDANSLIGLIESGVTSFLLKPMSLQRMLEGLIKEFTHLAQRRDEKFYQEKLEKELDLKTRELQKALSQTQRLQEAKDHMLTLISHELRTPLNGLMGFTGLLLDIQSTQEGTEFAQEVLNCARRLEGSVERVIDFTLIRTGNKIIKLKTTKIKNLLLSVTQSLQELELGTFCDTLQVLGDQEVSITTDPALLAQALLNVIENATKYAGPTPVISLRILASPEKIVLQIIDNGPGFPEDLLVSNFEPFVSGSLMNHQKGLGLGLALTQVIVTALGGEMEVRNYQDGGALVAFSFPTSLPLSGTATH